MKKLGELLKEARESKHLTVNKVASELLLKEDVIESLEEGRWSNLPDPAYVRGFIKNYCNFLNLDANRLLALYRAEFDESKYPQKKFTRGKRRLMFTPEKLAPLLFFIAIVIFVFYLIAQSTSVASAPKLTIYSPQNDITTTASVIEVSGQTTSDATISINGDLIPVDSTGNFSHQIKLVDGQNTIEIVASRKLSPKSKQTRIVRLSR